MTFADVQPWQPPKRYFWRRAIAFLIDATLANIVISVVLIAITMATGFDLGVPGIASWSTCAVAPSNLPAARQVETLWPLSAGETRSNIFCNVSILGSNGFRLFRSQVGSSSKSGAMTTTTNRYVDFTLDEAGNALPFRPTLDLKIPLIIVVFAAFSANGRRSPGKRLLALRVCREDGSYSDWGGALKRESLKFLPFILQFILLLWVLFAQAGRLSSTEAVIAGIKDGPGPIFILPAAIAIFGIVWWFGPFLFWRGRTWYDGLAGTKVIRT